MPDAISLTRSVTRDRARLHVQGYEDSYNEYVQETAAPPHASMMLRPSERVRLMPEVWITVSGWCVRERWRRAGLSCDSFCVAEGWKP